LKKIAKLTTLEYTKGFLKSVQNKLANEKCKAVRHEESVGKRRQKKKQMH
jgi:valyl-tRNA synthetase